MYSSDIQELLMASRHKRHVNNKLGFYSEIILTLLYKVFYFVVKNRK